MVSTATNLPLPLTNKMYSILFGQLSRLVIIDQKCMRCGKRLRDFTPVVYHIHRSHNTCKWEKKKSLFLRRCFCFIYLIYFFQLVFRKSLKLCFDNLFRICSGSIYFFPENKYNIYFLETSFLFCLSGKFKCFALFF